VSRDYFEIANQYADDILSGKIPSCNYVKWSCERFVNDLTDVTLPYKMDLEKASRACKFIELLPHIKGKWAREKKKIVLEPWQVFILVNVFGWVDDIGVRRFKMVYTEVPRKNAKSTLTSGVGLYMLTADGEEGAEVYSAATTRDQAKIVWQDAKRMVDKTSGIRERFGVKTSAHNVFVEDTSSVFKALSRDQGGNLDGLNVHCGLIDEVHAHKTREIWDVIETGTGARDMPLIWGITTAGFNRTGICYEQRAYVIKILNGTVEDNEYFGIIYTIDDDDDWTQEESWIKANPNWGVSVNPDDIARKARKAMEMPSATNNFLTKHLNVWVNADTAWMDMRKWDKAANDQITLEDFEGYKAWLAIDLASKTDIASIAAIIEIEDHKKVAIVFNFLPEDAAEDGRNSQYGGWVIEERLITTPGNVLDQSVIEEKIFDLCDFLDVQEVMYDPWQAAYLATRLQEEGVDMIEYRQTVGTMSEPMKTLEAWILDGTLLHTGCPVLTWMISNVVAHLDAKDNIYPRKEFPENKIDGVVAIIMAIGRYIQLEDNSSVYEERGIRTL
jgi:phage terminase large subunit-like protein